MSATISGAAARRPAERETLTEREREVVDLVARGRSDADVAAEFQVDPSTGKTHVADAPAGDGLPDRVGS